MLTVTKRQQIIRIILFFFDSSSFHLPSLSRALTSKKNVSTCDVLMLGSVEWQSTIVFDSTIDNARLFGILISNCVSYVMIHAKNIQLNRINNLIGVFIYTSLWESLWCLFSFTLSQLSSLPIVEMISCNELIAIKQWVEKKDSQWAQNLQSKWNKILNLKWYFIPASELIEADF